MTCDMICLHIIALYNTDLGYRALDEVLPATPTLPTPADKGCNHAHPVLTNQQNIQSCNQHRAA